MTDNDYAIQGEQGDQWAGTDQAQDPGQTEWPARERQLQERAMNAYQGEALTGMANTTSSFIGTPRHYCSRDQHYFECRHATHCYCGHTGRLNVPEGL